MWDISILKKVNEYYIVMCADGETRCIDEDTLQLYLRNNRVFNYEQFNNETK